MIDDDLVQRVARGEADEAELREIARRLETGDEAARSLAARIADERLIAGWFEGEADPGFVDETAAAARTGSNDPVFLARTLQRIDRRRRAPRPAADSFAKTFGAVAAVLLLGFGLLLWSSLPEATPPATSRPPLVAHPKETPPPVERPTPAPVPPAPRPEPPPPLVVPPTLPKPSPTPPEPPAPVPQPTPPPPTPAPAPRPTVVAFARLERIEGSVALLSSEGRSDVTAPADFPPGRSVEVGKPGRARLRFPDATTVDLGPGTKVSELSEGEGGKHLTIALGTLEAEVAKQPAGRAFVLQTPHGEARVLGTTLRLSVDAAATRLDVVEGRVRLTRSDKKAVDVASGHFAVAASGAELVSRSVEGFTLKEIPAQGLALWLRAESGVTSTAGAVSAWADQSGNRRDATQESAARRPLWIPDALRGRPALRFDGGDDGLATTLPIEGLSGLTIAIVAANSVDATGGPAHGENAAVFWPETVDWGWVYLSPFQSNVKFRFGTTQPGNLPFHIRNAPTSAFTLTVSVKDGPVESLYVQGVLAERVTGKAAAIKGTQPALQIGSGAQQKGFPGDIAEVLVYTRALADADRQRLERALLSKYFK